MQQAQQPAQPAQVHADVMLTEHKSKGSACLSWTLIIHHRVFEHILLVS